MSTNKKLHRINNHRFSIRLVKVANIYGFKTVGSFHKFLKQLKSPSVKLYLHQTHIRARRLLNELEAYLNEQ